MTAWIIFIVIMGAGITFGELKLRQLRRNNQIWEDDDENN